MQVSYSMPQKLEKQLCNFNRSQRCQSFFKFLVCRRERERKRRDHLVLGCTVGMHIFRCGRREKENSHEPRWSDELFKATHTNKRTGQFCSDKARKAQEDYENSMREKYGHDQVKWPPFDETIWYTVTNNNAHGDNCGLGALGKTRSMSRTDGSSSSQMPSSQSVSSAAVAPRLTQEDINAIAGQVLASVQVQLDVFFERVNKLIKRKASRSSRNEDDIGNEGADELDSPCQVVSKKKKSQKNEGADDDVGNEGADDDDDNSDDQI